MDNYDIDRILGIEQPQVKLALAEYIDGIEDEDFKERCKSIFNPYRDLIHNINVMYGVMPFETMLEVIVCKDSNSDPQTGMHIFELGDSYINQCLEIQTPDFSEVVDEYPGDLNVEELAAMISMMWIYCHEHFHYIRMHQEVKKRLAEEEGSDFDEQLTDYAIERDADLCAVAVVYRYLQETHYGLMSDLMIRQLTAFFIFWWMRPIFSLEHGPRHLSMATRMYTITTKLAIITELNSASEVVDRDFKEEKSKIQFSGIIDCLVKCENIYLERFDKTGGQHSLKAFREKLQTDNTLFNAVTRWEEMRPLVNEISQTRA